VASLDRLERLTDLVLVLLRASHPLTLDEIANDVPGYPANRDARRQAFERDKRLLRDEGIPVATEPIDGPEQFGYRIYEDAFYLPDLGLDLEEQAALQLAVAGVHLGDPSGRDALLKLGAAGLPEPRPLASLSSPAAMALFFEAVRTRAQVSFSYRNEVRTFVPARLWFRNGHWYVIGWDLDRQGARTFRIDRIKGSPTMGASGSGHAPDSFDPSDVVVEEPWRLGPEEDDDVIVLVDPVEADRIVYEVGAEAVQERRPDGSVVIRLGVTSPEAMRSWLLGLLDHVEVLGPLAERARMVDWLKATAQRQDGGRDALDSTSSASRSDRVEGMSLDLGDRSSVDPKVEPQDKEKGEIVPSGAGTRDARARLRRLLAVVGWLARVGEASISEVAERFGLSEAELVRELELAACCGVPPYSPDVLMEIVVTDTTVEAFLPHELGRPRRLTPGEGFALSAAARTILSVPGADAEGSLASALAKLEAVLGDQEGLVMDIAVPPLLEEVRLATNDHKQIEIEYHSASADETSVRKVDPIRVVSLDGHWYLDAFCQKSGGIRRFRVDRVRSLELTGVAVEVDPTALSIPDAFVPGPGATPTRLLLDPEAAWVIESVPLLDVHLRPDGAYEVALAVGGVAWLERLLLQAGPHARVVDPPEWSRLGEQAARRVLERYGGD